MTPKESACHHIDFLTLVTKVRNLSKDSSAYHRIDFLTPVTKVRSISKGEKT